MTEMVKILQSFKSLTKVYYIVFLLYFSFFLANGGMEYNIPFIFDARGISESGYGIFLSILNLLEILLPLTIVFLIKRYSPVTVNVFFLMISILAAFLIAFTKYNSILFAGLLMLCAMRTIFNFSVGNQVNLSIPAGIRGEYFAIRDLFLYGAIAVSTFLSSRIIAKSRMENVYLLLSLAFVITMACSFKLKKKLAPREEEAAGKIKLKAYFQQMRPILKNRTFIALLIIQIASIVYSVCLKFVPLLALKRGVSVSVFLQYTGLFTVINCVGSLILAYLVKGANKKKVYLLDLAFDVFSALLFVFSRQSQIFLIGYCISLLKDMFAPVSFAYLYDCIDDQSSGETAPVTLGLLSTISNIVNILIPLVVGIYWSQYFYVILAASIICLTLAVFVGIRILPVEAEGREEAV